MWTVNVIPERYTDGTYRIAGVRALGFDSVVAKEFANEAQK